jgi:hypothetical protein
MWYDSSSLTSFTDNYTGKKVVVVRRLRSLEHMCVATQTDLCTLFVNRETFDQLRVGYVIRDVCC